MHNPQQTFLFTRAITPEQLYFFDTHGYIHFKNFIDKTAVSDLVQEAEKVQRFLIANKINKVNGIPLKFGKDINDTPLIQRIAFASNFSKPLLTFLHDKRLTELTALLGTYEGRIGENEKDGLVINHYLNTVGSEFTQMGWHTDSPRDLFMGSRIMPMLNVGLHLDDCPAANGGLRVLAGTHKQNILRLLFHKKYFLDNRADKKEISFDIEAGDLTVHDGRLWHRVQQSPFIGEQSRRRVMYIPVVTGRYKPKNRNSPTPFYHVLGQLQHTSVIKSISSIYPKRKAV